MGQFKPDQLPESFRKRMAKEQRKELGVTTMDEANAKLEKIAERELHTQFENWLRLNQIPFIHSRMDRKSTIREGWPDFTLVVGAVPPICIEMKVGNGQLSDVQKTVVEELLAAKVPVGVCYTVEEAILFAREHFKL